jgi:hypothetical protein
MLSSYIQQYRLGGPVQSLCTSEFYATTPVVQQQSKYSLYSSSSLSRLTYIV